MSHDPLIALPPTKLVAEAPAPPVVEAPGAALPAPTPEQVRAADGVFADRKESDTVVGLIGMWTGVLLLHDLAVEHLDRPAEEEQPRPKLPKKDEPE